MIDFNKTSGLVKHILETDPHSRNSDDYLYCMVLRHLTYGHTNFKILWSAEYLLLRRKELGFPSFETVRRTRQKIQAEHPELKAVASVEAARIEYEKEYRAFSYSGKDEEHEQSKNTGSHW